MKLVIRHKGGSGSGFHGHAGRPGDVGGSSGGGSGGGGSESVSTRSLSDDDINATLSGTKYTSKNKALRSYGRGGIKSKGLASIHDRVSKLVPEQYAKAFTVLVANNNMNGSFYTTVPFIGPNREGSGSGAMELFMANDKVVVDLFKKTKVSTLSAYNDAMVKLDAAR